jgi:hypothetical protein
MIDPPGTDLAFLEVVLAIAADAYLIPKKTLPCQRQAKRPQSFRRTPSRTGR